MHSKNRNLPATVLMLVVLAVGLSVTDLVVKHADAAPPATPRAEPKPPGPLAPEQSRQTIRVPDGFQVELIAAEPLVVDPIAFDWGADGSLWVVEMGDYPVGADGSGQPGGQVKRLTDTNGDGQYDQATVFLDRLQYPTGVTVWRDGILVCAAPEIIYAEDTNGDGQADRREVLYRGFHQGNPQHQVNSFVWGLDNWVHLAGADHGGTIESLKTGQQVSINGRDVRIRPDTGAIDPQTGWSQFGRTRDDWGHWFGTSSEDPILHFPLADQWLRRNPHLLPPACRVRVMQGDELAVYPISRVISHWEDYRPPETGQPHRFTSACGTIVYRDSLFGPEFCNNTFTSEPALNLIHRRVLKRHGIHFSSARPAGETHTEFLASTDPWFRPTSLRTGPDGGLWVADMYRQVIEHPDWIDDGDEQTLDLQAGSRRGRIYRVRPAQTACRPWPRLDEYSTEQLVAELASLNGWRRDRAQQMLIWQNDPAAIPPLQTMLTNNPSPLGRLHALCTLAGLHGLTAELLNPAMADRHAGVRRHAARLVETLQPVPESTLMALLSLVDDRDAMVQLECAYALGQMDDPRAGQALGQMALRHADDAYRLAAVVSSIRADNLDQVLASVFVGQAGQAPPGPLLRRLLSVAADMGDRTALVRVLARLSHTVDGQYATWQLSALAGVLDALERQNLSLAAFETSSTDAQLQQALKRIETMFGIARETVADSTANVERRQQAIALLGRGTHRAADWDRLAACLEAHEPPELQRAAVARLGRGDGPRPTQILLDQLPRQTPQLRAAILDVLLRREAWLPLLLDRIAAGKLHPDELGFGRRAWLLNHPNRTISQQAQQVLAEQPVRTTRAKVVAAYQHVLEMPGDPRRGEQVFQQKCAICHQASPDGTLAGPNLSSMTTRSPQAILTAILDPNRKVPGQFQRYVAMTTTGEQFTGILGEETSNSITLIDPQGRRQVIGRTQLETLLNTRRSLMPEGIEQDLSPRDLADVIALVLGQSPSPEPPALDRQTILAADGQLVLPVEAAHLQGSKHRFEQQGKHLIVWAGPESLVVWTIRLTADRAGDYQVYLTYACDHRTAGKRLELTFGPRRLTRRVLATGGWDQPREMLLGTVRLTAGTQSVTLGGAKTATGTLLDLQSLRLVPVPRVTLPGPADE